MEAKLKTANPRILIIRLSAIGDVVRALPVLHVLRENMPEATIDWVVESKAAAVLEGHPYLDNLFVFERRPGMWESIRAFAGICRQVRAHQYDMAVDVHGIFKSGILAFVSGAKKRYAFAPPRGQELSYLFANKWVRLSSKKLNRVEENLALCESVTKRVGWPSITIQVPVGVQEYVESFFDEHFQSAKQIIAVHAPVDRPEKQWPLAHFAELCDMLLADGRFEVLLTWGPGQLPIAQEVAHRCRRAPVVAPETPDLKHYAWMIHLSHLYFGGDTGPMHIASAMGTPVVAVFGGTDPAKHAPYRPPFRVLNAYDPPETKGLPLGERLRSVTAEMAYDACVGLLSELRSKDPASR